VSVDALLKFAWLFDQLTTVGAVASIMVEAWRSAVGFSAGPVLPATSVPAPAARVTVAVTPSAQELTPNEYTVELVAVKLTIWQPVPAIDSLLASMPVTTSLNVIA